MVTRKNKDFSIRAVFMAGILLFLALPAILSADYIKIFNIDKGLYPTVSAEFFAFREDGTAIRDFDASRLEIFENGIKQKIINSECFGSQDPIALSVVITLDISGSMSGPRMESAKAAAIGWVDVMDMSISECAISSFNHQNYLNQDFTSDRALLKSKISSLFATGGTDYNAGFIDPPAGALQILEKASGNRKRVLLFLTDGQTDGNEEEIITAARRLGVTVYCVTLDINAPDILRNICDQTGGLLFDNITTEAEAEAAFQTILEIEQGGKPCIVSWKSNICSESRELLPLANGFSGIAEYYSIEKDKLKRLEIQPKNYHDFGKIPIGSKPKAGFDIIARNDSISITEIKVNQPFRIIFPSKAPPLRLLKDSLLKIEIEYSPADTNYVTGTVEILSDACQQGEIFLAGGSRSGQADILKVDFPDGGEKLASGLDTLIKWSGLLPIDSVSLDYSLDSGRTWTEITKTDGFNYLWKVPVINQDRNQCLMRARYQSSDIDEVIYLKGHSGAVTVNVWDPVDNTVISGGDDGLILNWNSSSGKIIDTIASGLPTILSLAISRNGNYLVSSHGNEVILWRKVNKVWKKFQELESGMNQYLSLAFSPDDIFIAGGDVLGNLTFWETLNKPKVSEKKIHDGGITSLCWNTAYPNLPIIYTASSDGLAKAMNVSSIQDITEDKFLDLGSPVSNMTINNASDLLAVSTQNMNVSVLNTSFFTVDTVLSIKSAIMSVSFSNDNKYLACGGEAKTVLLFEADNNWNKAFEYYGHTDNISTLSWTSISNKNYIASGSYDSFIDIWSPEDIPFDQPLIMDDVSDAVWEIHSPRTIMNDIYFKNVEIGNSIDTLVTGVLKNSGDVDILIDSLSISGPGKASYSYMAISLPQRIIAGDSLNLEIKFKPVNTGINNASLVFGFNGIEKSCILSGEGESSKIKILNSLIDFGKVTISSQKRLTQQILMNISSKDVVIDSIRIFGPDLTNFRIISANGIEQNVFNSIRLGPGEELELELEFSPKSLNRTTSGLAIYYDGVNESALPQVQLVGTGIDFQLDVPSTLGFEINYCVPTNRDSSIILSNIGEEAITIESLEITGTDISEFRFDSTFIGKVIAGNSGIELPLWYLPSSSGRKEAVLEIRSYINPNESKLTLVNLIGITEYSELKLSRDSIDFGIVPSDLSDTAIVHIINTGSLPVEFDFPQQSGAFVLDSIVPNILPINGTANVYIRFPASPEGEYTGKFILHDTCGQAYEIALKCNVYYSFAEIITLTEIKYPDIICNPITQDTIITIRNDGNDTLTIFRMYFSSNGDGGDEYRILNNFGYPFDVLPGDAVGLIIEFNSSGTGERSDTLNIVSNAKNTADSLTKLFLNCNFNTSNFSLDTDTLSFGDIPQGHTETREFNLINNSSISQSWGEYPVQSGRYTILSVEPASTAPNGGISLVTARFDGGTEGEIINGFYDFTDTCANSQRIHFTSNVIAPSASTISIGNTCGYPGDTIYIPIYLLSETNIPENFISGYDGVLKVDSKLLSPMDGYPGVSFEEGYWLINLSLPARPLSDSTLASIPMISISSYSDSSYIGFQDIVSTGGYIVINTIDGKFVSGCGEEINYPIAKIGNLKLYQNYPNPTSGETEFLFELFNDDSVQLELYDIQSNFLLDILPKTSLKAGKYTVSMDLSQYSQGVYFFTLLNQSSRITGKLIILR